MKFKFIILLFFLISFTKSNSQTKSKLINHKILLGFNEIKKIEIRKQSSKEDTPEIIHKVLSTDQIKLFVEKFNKGTSIGLYKCIVEYWVEVSLKNGNKRVFRVNSNHIKENNDYTYDLDDKNYLDQLWQTTK